MSIDQDGAGQVKWAALAGRGRRWVWTRGAGRALTALVLCGAACSAVRDSGSGDGPDGGATAPLGDSRFGDGRTDASRSAHPDGGGSDASGGGPAQPDGGAPDAGGAAPDAGPASSTAPPGVGAEATAAWRECEWGSDPSECPSRWWCRDADGVRRCAAGVPGACADDRSCACVGASLCGARACVEGPDARVTCLGAEPPACGGRGLAERWSLGDGCNGCRCTDVGVECGDVPCHEGCLEPVQEYQRLLASAHACTQDADCTVAFPDCNIFDGVGLAYVHRTFDVAALDAQARLWRDTLRCGAGGGHSCGDFGGLPEAACVEGSCAPAGFTSAECVAAAPRDYPRWAACNRCDCGGAGLVCTARECPESCDALAAEADAALEGARACATDADCRARALPHWRTGMTALWAPMRVDVYPNDLPLEELAGRWFASRCVRPPRDTGVAAPAVACDAGRCTLR